MKHSFTIYRNNFVAIGIGIMFFIWGILPTIFGIIFLKEGKKDLAIFCLLLVVVIPPLYLTQAPIAWSRVTFTDEGVYCKVPYKKAVKREYRNYPYILRGYYFHGTPMGSVGKWVSFIVLTNRRYSDADLYQINLVNFNEDTIIIKNTPKNRRRLCAVLPPNMRNTLLCTFRE